jgi:hypothetical protein
MRFAFLKASRAQCFSFLPHRRVPCLAHRHCGGSRRRRRHRRRRCCCREPAESTGSTPSEDFPGTPAESPSLQRRATSARVLFTEICTAIGCTTLKQSSGPSSPEWRPPSLQLTKTGHVLPKSPPLIQHRTHTTTVPNHHPLVLPAFPVLLIRFLDTVNTL